jgi:Phospholipase_D-nuclease N-terminal
VGWLWWVGAVAIVAWVVAIVDVIRGRARFSRGQLAAWILIVIILPVIGTILYFVAGRRPSV